MKILEPDPLGSNSVDIGRAHDTMPHATQPISSLLISDKKQKIRTLTHYCSSLFSLAPQYQMSKPLGKSEFLCEKAKAIANLD
jgi:hypothetical protein